MSVTERQLRRQAVRAARQPAVPRAMSRVPDDIHVSPAGHVVLAPVMGQRVFFTITNPEDLIQRHHLGGAFYEPEELAIIARHFPVGGRLLDIGSNVGNHALYAAIFLHAQRVVCFEPNPAVIAVLRSNVALNGLGDIIDLSHLGIGLSDQAAGNVGMKVPPRNMGGGRMVAGRGDLRLERADTLLGDETFDLIKIDVEGMELSVLEGLSGLLAHHRPKMFIEVDNTNADGFDAWLARNEYRVLESFQRYRVNVNHLVGPQT